MKNKKVLIIGGGVAGCSCAYFLKNKGYEVTILEKNNYLGGLSATHHYNGHPYEFGPHVWFWPNDNINKVIDELTEGELYDVPRKLYTFTGEDLYRYPIHMSDIENMPDKDKILEELKIFRDDNLELKADIMPKIGQCTFYEYFTAAVGPTLYDRFMKDYTYKMWGITGEDLETSMVWADRIKDHYTDKPYDPIKFKDHFLGAGQPNWYPKKGWNVVWDKMAEGCTVRMDCHVDSYKSIENWAGTVGAVIWTRHSDEFFGENTLPANGRLIIPFLLPEVSNAFPSGAESIHFSDQTPITRTTEMKTITRYGSNDSLVLLEVPLNSGTGLPFKDPKLFHPRCYNHQTPHAKIKHEVYVEQAKKIMPNIHFCGRHAEFKYWGMPQVVDAAYRLVEEKF